MINDCHGLESHQNSFLYRKESAYVGAFRSKTIIEVLKEDLKVLEYHRDIASFRLIHHRSHLAVINALDQDPDKSMVKFYALLKPETQFMMIKPVELVFSHPSCSMRRLWTLNNLSG